MSFSVERAISSNTVVRAAYVGKLAHNLVRMVQKNPATYIPGQSTTANTDQRRPLLPGTYASFREIAANSNAAYHSLQLTLNRRFTSGFTFLGAYTLGKLLDYYSAQNLGQVPQNPLDHAADRSRIGRGPPPCAERFLRIRISLLEDAERRVWEGLGRMGNLWFDQHG
jgi:hypothetical protein